MNLKEKILELRDEGLNYDQIKEKLNCSKSTISYHCKKNNMGGEVYLKKRKFNLSKEDIDLVLKLRINKKTYNEIRKETNLSYDKISYICRNNNLEDPNKFKTPSEEDIKEMQEIYDECGNSNKVAERCGWSKFTVLKYVKTIKRIKKITTSESVVDWRRRTKIKLVEYKGGKCEICGYDKCTSALSFHHKVPTEKDFSISSKSYSFERLKEEVDKCMLVCQNCHIEIHENLKPSNDHKS